MCELAAGQGNAAAAEFQKIIDHNGIGWNCWTGSLAHLGVARANALQSRTSQGTNADAARVRARTRISSASGEMPTRHPHPYSDFPGFPLTYLMSGGCASAVE